MNASDGKATAGGAQLSGTPSRPAHLQESERGEHAAESVLSLMEGAGPGQSKEDCMAFPRRLGRPVRFEDPARNAAYWARIDRIVDGAPPLSDEQRAIIRTAFHQPATREAA